MTQGSMIEVQFVSNKDMNIVGGGSFASMPSKNEKIVHQGNTFEIVDVFYRQNTEMSALGEYIYMQPFIVLARYSKDDFYRPEDE